MNKDFTILKGDFLYNKCIHIDLELIKTTLIPYIDIIKNDIFKGCLLRINSIKNYESMIEHTNEIILYIFKTDSTFIKPDTELMCEDLYNMYFSKENSIIFKKLLYIMECLFGDNDNNFFNYLNRFYKNDHIAYDLRFIENKSTIRHCLRVIDELKCADKKQLDAKTVNAKESEQTAVDIFCDCIHEHPLLKGYVCQTPGIKEPNGKGTAPDWKVIVKTPDGIDVPIYLEVKSVLCKLNKNKQVKSLNSSTGACDSKKVERQYMLPFETDIKTGLVIYKNNHLVLNNKFMSFIMFLYYIENNGNDFDIMLYFLSVLSLLPLAISYVEDSNTKFIRPETRNGDNGKAGKTTSIQKAYIYNKFNTYNPYEIQLKIINQYN